MFDVLVIGGGNTALLKNSIEKRQKNHAQFGAD
jgi:hypothetical protein